MTPGAAVAAAVVVLATTMPVHARTEPMGGGPSPRGVTRQAAVGSAAPPGEGAEAGKPQAAAAAGAIYSPFSGAPGFSSARATAAPPPDADFTGLGLTVAVALAGAALCGYVLRRALQGR